MKRNLVMLILFICAPFWVAAQLSVNQKASQQPLKIKGNFLLKTNWDQWGTFAKYSPENNVLGCWSTALAQILFYYQLKPFGDVEYVCSKGYQIKDTLSKYPLEWGNPETPPLYSYMTAIAIRKDFGTPRYKAMVNPGPYVESHFACKTQFYVSFQGAPPFSAEQLTAISNKEQIKKVLEQHEIEALIKEEIDGKRPVYFHMANFSSYGHSTVIDGFKYVDHKFLVHINYGSAGFRTGWYELFKPIDVEDDMRLRAFMIIKVKD